ncbi:aminoalkylphosphonate N-acetyltransferase [Spirosoma arcticum]
MVYGFLCDLEKTMLDRSCFRAIFRKNVTNPMIHYLVAERDERVVGFVSYHIQYLLHHTGKVGEIQELYIRPDLRNQRIGSQLIATLDALAHREDLVQLEVTTNQIRTDTVRFYEREHFSRTHVKLVKSCQF